MKWPTSLNPIAAAVLFAGLYTRTNPLSPRPRRLRRALQRHRLDPFCSRFFLRHDETKTVELIKQTAWGGYRTEFYPTYDFKSVWNARPHHRA